MEKQKQPEPSHIPRRYTERRINLVAIINAQMRKTYQQYSEYPLTENEKDCISCMAEDLAFQLPEDTTFGDLNGLNVDTILDYVRTMRQKEQDLHRPQSFYHRWWTAFRQKARTLTDPALVISILIGFVIASTIILLWGLL